MIRKKAILGLTLAVMVSSLSGCATSENADVINQLNSLQGMNTEFNEGQVLSFSERQALLYKRLRDHSLLKLSGLSTCNDTEVNECFALLDVLDMQLTGKITSKAGSVSQDITDYMLTWFEQTPYYWQRTGVEIQGKDNKNGCIVVDVTYKTIDFEKDVLRDSSIPLGENGYDQLMETRFTKALEIYDLRYKLQQEDEPSEEDAEKLEELEKKFEKAYGTIPEVIEEQNTYTPSEYIYLEGNQRTTSGVAEATEDDGTVTFRFILNHKYAYGINLGLQCQHMYMLKYTLGDGVVADTDEPLDMAGYNTLSDSVYKLIKSYFTCIDEHNYTGMRKLTHDFGTLDKWYQDWLQSTRG